MFDTLSHKFEKRKAFMFKDMLKQFTGPQFWKKFCMMIFGVFFMGFFLSFLLEIGWGTDSYTFQNSIISMRIGWEFGNWQLLLNIILLIIMVIFNRRLIGIGTIANMVLIGYISDFFRWVWKNHFPLLSKISTSPDFLWAKILVFIAVILLFVISAAFYINARMGLSPYDGLATIIGEKLRKIPPVITRMAYDFTFLLVGVLASIGSGIDISTSLIGSIAMSLSLGPAIQLVGKLVNKKILKTEGADEGLKSLKLHQSLEIECND